MSEDLCPRCGARFAGGRLAVCPACLLSDDGEADDGTATEATLVDTADEAPPAVESLAGRYDIQALLGAGGMARVYAARDRRSGERVALKLLALGADLRPGMLERFRREARTLAQVRHPHVVELRGFGRDGPHAYIAMELVDGPALLGEAPAAPARVVAVTRQICAALEYAHAHGIVHRDLKPSNVLLDREGRVKVADFGIAGLLPGTSDDTRVTLDHVTVGTPAYMAPEARAGAAPDPRMDVYSLGVLMYELLTGRVPTGVLDLPGGPLDHVLARALAHDPARRYGTIAALLHDLPALDAEETAARALPRSDAALRGAVALALAAGTLVLLDACGSLLQGAHVGGLAVASIVWGNAAVAAGLTLHALLMRRWTQLGYGPPPRPEVSFEAAPDSPLLLAAARPWPLLVAAAGLAAFGARWPADEALRPLGVMAAALGLFGFWIEALEARRTDRPLQREWLLLLGLALIVASRLLLAPAAPP